MEKLKMHTPDLTQDHIVRIRELFPNCVTEARDESGKLKLAVDFDQLKQELSDSIVEGPQERYHLNWPGKREALLTANAPIAKTLRPCREESVDFDTTKNLFIEGDIPYAEQVFLLIDSVFSASQLPQIGDDRKPKANPLNSNFEKKEFQELWARINRKAVYRVEFDSTELIKNCIKTLNKELRVSPLQYTIQIGIQGDQITDGQLKAGESFQVQNTVTEAHKASIHSSIKYDLLGKIAENVQLTRKTVAEIFKGMEAAIFAQFKQNPEHFIAEASRLIKEQKATIIIERLSYDEVAGSHDVSIFTAGQSKQDFTKATDRLKNHIYDYVITDSKVERDFVRELDTSAEVTVYAKLPRGFLIPKRRAIRSCGRGSECRQPLNPLWGDARFQGKHPAQGGAGWFRRDWPTISPGSAQAIRGQRPQRYWRR